MLQLKKCELLIIVKGYVAKQLCALHVYYVLINVMYISKARDITVLVSQFISIPGQ